MNCIISIFALISLCSASRLDASQKLEYLHGDCIRAKVDKGKSCPQAYRECVGAGSEQRIPHWALSVCTSYIYRKNLQEQQDLGEFPNILQ